MPNPLVCSSDACSSTPANNDKIVCVCFGLYITSLSTTIGDKLLYRIGCSRISTSSCGYLCGVYEDAIWLLNVFLGKKNRFCKFQQHLLGDAYATIGNYPYRLASYIRPRTGCITYCGYDVIIIRYRPAQIRYIVSYS